MKQKTQQGVCEFRNESHIHRKLVVFASAVAAVAQDPHLNGTIFNEPRWMKNGGALGLDRVRRVSLDGPVSGRFHSAKRAEWRKVTDKLRVREFETKNSLCSNVFLGCGLGQRDAMRVGETRLDIVCATMKAFVWPWLMLVEETEPTKRVTIPRCARDECGL
jgi:hypothetical protein